MQEYESDHMSTYTDSVASGLEAVSTGICPGCDECRSAFDHYRVEESDLATCARESCPDGIRRATGSEPVTCESCRKWLGLPELESAWAVMGDPDTLFESEELAESAARQAFDDAVRDGGAVSEGNFSHGGCDICNSGLGGDFEPWHGLDSDGELVHGERACRDCVMYLANGEEPEE